MEILTGLALGIAGSVVALVFVLLAVWGLIDILTMLRFRKSHKIDKSAIMGNWFNLKWMFVTRKDELAEKLPWLGQDLSEVLGVKEDDGKTS